MQRKQNKVVSVLLVVAMCLTSLPVRVVYADDEVSSNRSIPIISEASTDESDSPTPLPQEEEVLTGTEEQNQQELEPVAEVARIGTTMYPTLAEAVAAAVDGAVIELLADCTTENGLNLSKNLTIQAVTGLESKPTITFRKYGIALWGKKLTIQDCNVVMNGVGSTPYYQEWSWMSICGQAGSELNLVRVDMTMDGQGMNKHAIYADNGMRLYLEKSDLVIRNYVQDALEWNGGGFDYNVEMVDSTYLSDNNRSGFTGSFDVKATNSKIDIINSRGNGSNGSNFYFLDSVVNFSENGAHGLSANKLESVNTTITANDNGRWGIAANTIKFENCKDDARIQANNNGYNGLRVAYASSFAGNPSKFDAINTDMEFLNNGHWKVDDIWPGVTMKNVVASIDGTSSLTIQGSPNTGLVLTNSVVDIAEGADITITGNHSGYINGGGQGIGGGVRVGSDSSLKLPSDAKIYNNHAELAGDDIYCASGGTITFGKVGEDWTLDNSENAYRPDAVRCGDGVDGWYYDNEAARWNAHKNPVYAEQFSEYEFDANGMTTVEGVLALKAAHGVTPVDPAEPDVPNYEWERSKSKTATNLDENFESQVTLSLPAAEEELVTDVVFVFDESSCGIPVRTEVRKMLNDLYEQVKSTGATVNVGAVQFRGKVTEFPLTALTEETAEQLYSFMGRRPWVGGSNMNMGLLAGEQMLDASSTSDNRKHLILVSDGIAYIWDDETTPERENLGVNFSNADAPTKPFLASPDGWDVKYGAKYVPEDWDQHFDAEMIERTIREKSSVYRRYADISNNPYVGPSEQTEYASTVDVALYKSMQTYRSIASKYNVDVVLSGVDREMEVYPFGPSFMNYLADGHTVSFDQIQKEIFYLLDAGSRVVDTIGYGIDDKGNEYNMDFVPNEAKLTLTVDGEMLDVEEIEVVDSEFTGSSFETSCFGFGAHEDTNYDFVLHYYEKGKDGQSDECFVWDINVPVSNFAPVQLTYTVKLTNPQSAPGTYGVYDADGSQKLSALYTNQEAILYPMDSYGGQGIPEYFAKPTVSYTVEEQPVNPDPEHPVDPEEPVGPNRPTDPENPLNPEQPDSPERPADPEQNPKTGDEGSVLIWFWVSLVSICGVFVLASLNRKRKGDVR